MKICYFVCSISFISRFGNIKERKNYFKYIHNYILDKGNIYGENYRSIFHIEKYYKSIYKTKEEENNTPYSKILRKKKKKIMI